MLVVFEHCQISPFPIRPVDYKMIIGKVSTVEGGPSIKSNQIDMAFLSSLKKESFAILVLLFVLSKLFDGIHGLEIGN